MKQILTLRHGELDLNRANIMGILNVTPDSFSDGGRFNQTDAALRHVEQMIADGADIIDVGGESTRPGASEVGLDEELARVVQIIEAIRSNFDVPVSVDTVKPEVMASAVEAGADMINDVMALQMPGALETAARLGVPVCLMHMQGKPRSMQQAPAYEDVVADVKTFLLNRAETAVKAGIDRAHILIDPGFGFGKTLEHNYLLLAKLDSYRDVAYPLLVGMSRKSMIGNILNRDVEERLAGSLACALLAAQAGAKIIRVHDVKETADLLKIREHTEQYR